MCCSGWVYVQQQTQLDQACLCWEILWTGSVRPTLHEWRVYRVSSLKLHKYFWYTRDERHTFVNRCYCCSNMINWHIRIRTYIYAIFIIMIYKHIGQLQLSLKNLTCNCTSLIHSVGPYNILLCFSFDSCIHIASYLQFVVFIKRVLNIVYFNKISLWKVL